MSKPTSGEVAAGLTALIFVAGIIISVVFILVGIWGDTRWIGTGVVTLLLSLFGLWMLAVAAS